MKRESAPKLKLSKERLHLLSDKDLDQIKAGEETADDASATRPRTYACVAPFNAPPYYYGPVYPELEA